MNAPCLVFTCGYVACLKTSLSVTVAPRLSMNLVATFGMGAFDPSSPEKLAEDRQIRYQRLLEISDAYLSRGLSVWVDGNFPYRTLRSRVLDMARRYRIPEVVALHCQCSDLSVLEKRFESRRGDPDQPDAAATEISAYHGSVSQFEGLLDSEFAGLPAWEVLQYDSCRKSMAKRTHPVDLGSKICRQMAHCGFLSYV